MNISHITYQGDLAFSGILHTDSGESYLVDWHMDEHELAGWMAILDRMQRMDLVELRLWWGSQEGLSRAVQDTEFDADHFTPSKWESAAA